LTPSPEIPMSRPLAAAGRLGDAAPDRHQFPNKRVLLSSDAAQLTDATARYTLLMALRLVTRICRNVTVRLPATATLVRTVLEAEAKRIGFGAPIEFLVASEFDGFDAILHVGPQRELGLPWTSIVTNGWLVQAATTGGAAHSALRGTRKDRPVNSTAAVMAASLGTTEIFKQLIGLKPERGGPATGVPFSCYSYAVSDDPGPEFPRLLKLDAALIGFGALGNGIVAALDPLDLAGRLTVVDYQSFGPENLGTCVLLGPSDVGKSKAKVAVERLTTHGGLDVRPFEKDVMLFTRESAAPPTIVLTALDSGDARRAAQLLWPDLVIDGAIGDFMAQVGFHPGDLAKDVACVRCVYPPDGGGASSRVTAESATGLPSERLANQNDLLTEDDIQAAAEDKRPWLKQNVGKVKCSVVSEAVARAIAIESIEGFEPSAPFVACASAAMVMTELVRHAAGEESPIDPRFQFDLLAGPHNGLDFGRGRSQTCECVVRRPIIEALRAKRRGNAQALLEFP
jgi:molybdopterin/thiamine biosynthesis adenylyltransferase